jgi:hypothetical protein
MMCSSLVFSALFLTQAVAFGQAPPQAFHVLVISEDSKFVSRLEEGHDRAGSLAEFERELGEHERFLVQEWPQVGLIVLDRSIGVLEALRVELKFAQALKEVSAEDLTLHIGSVPDPQRSDLLSLLSWRFPEARTNSGAGLQQSAVGLYGSVMATVRGADGKTLKLLMPQTNEATRRREQALARHPVQRRRSETPEEREASNRVTLERISQRGRLPMQFLGRNYDLIPQGMKIASELIDEELKGLKSKRDIATRELADRLEFPGEPLPSGEARFGELPAQFRQNLQDQLGRDWKSHGFASGAEAESFLLGSLGIRTHTGVGFIVCTKPGDPGSMSPGLFMIYTSFWFPGGRAP